MRSPQTRRVPLILCLAVVALSTAIGCQDSEERKAQLRADAEAHVAAERWPEAVIDYRKLLKLDPNDPDAHFKLASAYVSADKPREALWEFSEAVRLDPENRQARLGLGTMAMFAKDLEETLAQAEAVLAGEPDQVSALLLRGQATEGLERYDEAESSFLRAVEVAEDKAPFYFILGSYYARRGDRESAEPPLVRFTELDPGRESYTALGRFLAEDPNRFDEAVRALQLAIESAPAEDVVPAYETLAGLRFAAGQLEEGARELEQAIAAMEGKPRRRASLMYALSRFYEQMGREDDFDALMEQAAKESEEDAKPHLILADHRAEKGDLEGALAAVDRAIEIAPENPNPVLRKAELLIDMGFKQADPARIAEGLAVADDILAGEPTNAMALYLKGKGAIALEEDDEAVRFLRESIDQRPSWHQSHLALGNVLARMGNTTAARAEVARAVELNPAEPEARKQLAALHAALGEHEYAIDQARIYLNARPDDAEMRLLVAASLSALGRPDDALTEVSELRDGTDAAQAHFAKGNLLLASGDLENARVELLAANELRPHHPTVLQALMNAEQRLGNLDAMGPLLEAAQREKPNDAALNRLQAIYAQRTGDAKAAEEMFRRAIELDDRDIESYRRLAQLYGRSGRVADLRALYDSALAKRPDSARLHYDRALFDQSEGREEAAIKGYERAIELDGDLADAKNNLAYMLAEDGRDLDRALDLAQEAKAAMPNSPNAADTLGYVLYKRGIPTAAVGYLREAVAGMETGSPEIGLVRHHLALAYEANDQKQLAIEALELSLSELESRKAAAQQAGSELSEPDWASDARERLGRLKSAS